jgi:hypothetical protein
MVPKEYCICTYPGCNRKGFYCFDSNRKAKFCSIHKEQGMICPKTRLCEEEGCLKYASYNYEGKDFPIFCFIHKQDKMINVIYPRCTYKDCKRIAIYKHSGDAKPSLCSEHREEGMINIQEVRCREFRGSERCSYPALYNYPNRRKAIYCVEHKKQGMVVVKSLKFCRSDEYFEILDIKTCKECNRRAIYGPPETGELLYCYRHKREDMTYNLVSPGFFPHEDRKRKQDDEFNEACELLLNIKSRRIE